MWLEQVDGSCVRTTSMSHIECRRADHDASWADGQTSRCLCPTSCADYHHASLPATHETTAPAYLRRSAPAPPWTSSARSKVAVLLLQLCRDAKGAGPRSSTVAN